MTFASGCRRIVIVGCSGSGKSTLARAIGATTGLPVTHLDALWWHPGWSPHPDPPAFRAQVNAIAAGDDWIIEGGFTEGTELRFERAELAVLFDLPTPLCLYRAIRRWATYRGRVRPDLAPGCPERFDLEFYRYIWTYRRAKLPVVEARLARHFRGRTVRLTRDAETRALLEELTSP